MVLQELVLLFVVVVRAECNITFCLALSGRFEAVLFPDALVEEGCTLRRLRLLMNIILEGSWVTTIFCA